ncbi:MAG TPA: primosomal replication protein N [Burkholderiaceae bacterium]|nr:primosomal replication protein N [Burkholderiaceae bacterium]
MGSEAGSELGSDSAMASNRVELSGVLVEREALRYTPAGIAMLNARLSHGSEVREAGQPRQVEFDVAVRFAGSIAARADRLALGEQVFVTGFLAPRRRQSKSLVLHVTDFASPHRSTN